MRQTERIIMLQVIDDQWKDHLLSMDHLKEGIHLRSYGQKDPLVEYKKESFILFQDMMDRIEDETLRYLFFMQVRRGDGGDGLGRPAEPVLPFPMDEDEDEDEEEEQHAAVAEQQKRAAQSAVQDMTRKLQRDKDKELAGLQFVGGDGSAVAKKQVVNSDKVGRNDPCPCGSGKKYKKCHGT
jgi:preprotein translocase subunit SecA